MRQEVTDLADKGQPREPEAHPAREVLPRQPFSWEGCLPHPWAASCWRDWSLT